MSLFNLKKSSDPLALEVSMAGLKLGSSLLQLGLSNEGMLTTLTKVVGISGESVVAVETDAEVKRVNDIARNAGVLIDVQKARFSSLSFDSEKFDVVVANDLIGDMRINERVLCLQQILQVLKPNGRCLVIEAAPRGGLGALFSQRSLDRTYVAYGGAEGALKAEGFRAVRQLAEREGKRYIEGMK
ncbi:MAG: class I SAM-dependent methyltransferase [Acidobacteriota bacterium]|nr:class I SAM-dependent methyltransferase [Acidobacteriota bacterium]|tara:strand:- start:75 stop:632 length:558 start_codon:yes stop_codon:yes gene_type:complete